MSKAHSGESTRLPISEPTIDDLRDLATTEANTDTEQTPPTTPPRQADDSLTTQIQYIIRDTFASIQRDTGRFIFSGRILADGSAVAVSGDSRMQSTDAAEDLVQFASTTGSVRAVSVLGTNCVVVDPLFDPNADVAQTLSKTVIPLPFETFQQFDITQRDITVLDSTRQFNQRGQRQYECVFHDGQNYYYRGGGWTDGWVGLLETPAETVREAKDQALKPDRVLAAENEGRDVIRQGDWFFVETDDSPSAIIRHPDVEALGTNDRQLGNHLAKWQGVTLDSPQRVFVKGRVEHLTEDHDTVYFGEWREAINNGVEAYSFEVNQPIIQLADTNLMDDRGAVRHQTMRSTRTGTTLHRD